MKVDKSFRVQDESRVARDFGERPRRDTYVRRSVFASRRLPPRVNSCLDELTPVVSNDRAIAKRVDRHLQVQALVRRQERIQIVGNRFERTKQFAGRRARHNLDRDVRHVHLRQEHHFRQLGVELKRLVEAAVPATGRR